MTRLHEATVRAHLQALGWTPGDGTAVASKTYETAVGPKTAHVYLTNQRQDDPNISLNGDYQSEGRNILEPHGVLLPTNANDETVRQLVEKFAKGADHAVGQSYAVRLLKA